MNIEEAIKAMKGGAKLTHKYLPAMGTQYLYVIDEEYVDSKGYILNKTDVESRLKANIFKFGWQKVESKLIRKEHLKMDEQTKKLASLNAREAENMAVEQFTKLYNEIDEKDLDMSKLELALRNTFSAGMVYKEAVIEKEKENMKSYKDGVLEMRDVAIDFDGDDDFFDKVWDKATELIQKFNS